MRSPSSPSRRLVLGVLFLLGLVWVSALAQQPAAPRKARFLPLGDAPPFRQEIRDGVRYELDPPVGSVPPPELAATVEPPQGGDEPPPPKPLQLRLGRLSEAIEVPGGAGPLRLATAVGQAPWIKLQRPETGDFLVLLWRKPGGAGWDEVLHRIVPDGPLGAPAGSFRVVNLFPQPLYLRWANESLQLKPGVVLQRSIAPAVELPFEVLTVDPKGQPKRYFRTSLSQDRGERGWILLYRADGESPRRPLKVLVLREPVFALAPPVPAADPQ